MTSDSNTPADKPYPRSWESRADVRVFRAPTKDWERLLQWRSDMSRRGWKLLRVSRDGDEMVAIFGRPRGG